MLSLTCDQKYGKDNDPPREVRVNRLTVVVTEEGHQYYVIIGKETRGPFPEFPEVRIVRSSEGACTVQVMCAKFSEKAYNPDPEVFFLESSPAKRSDGSRKTPSQPVNDRPSSRPPSTS